MDAVPAPQPDPKRWFALAVIAIAQLMIVLDASIVNIALPSAAKALNISAANQQWLLTAYTLTFGGLLLLGGRVADYSGRRLVFMISLLGFAGSSALGGLAQNQQMLFASRALQGCFAAFMAPAALSIITVTFTEAHERAKAFGVYGAIAGGGAAIGLVAGGLLTQFLNWRWCLFVNIPVAIIAFIGAVAFVHESKAEGATNYDLPGAVLITGGLAAVVYGFTSAAQHGWGSTTTLSWLTGGLLAVVAFVVWESKATNPLLPLRVVADRNRGGSFTSSFLVGVGMMGMFLLLTLYFQDVLGYSALRAAFAFLPFSAFVILSAGLSSKLLPKIGPRPLMSGGLTAAAIGMFSLSRITVGADYLSVVLPSCVLIAAGMGLTFVALSSTALTGVANHDAGVASATLNASQQVGGSLGVALLSTIMANGSTSWFSNWTQAHGQPSPAEIGALKAQAMVHGQQQALFVGSLAIFAAALVAFFAIRTAAPSGDEAMVPVAAHVG